MGSVLKVVYENKIELQDRTITFSNGIPSAIVDYVKNNLIVEDNHDRDSDYFLDLVKNIDQDWQGHIHLSDFYYYFARFYGHDRIVYIDDIVDNGYYIYPIELVGKTASWLWQEFSIKLDNMVLNYRFGNHFKTKTLDLLRAGRIKILVIIIYDPCHDASFLDQFEKYISDLGIDPGNIIFLFGNNYNAHYKLSPSSKFKFTTGNILLQKTALGYTNYPTMTTLGYVSDVVRETDATFHDLRPKKFLCFNRNMRPHRYILAYIAKKHNILPSSIFSFISHLSDESAIRKIIEGYTGENISQTELTDVINTVPLEIDTDHLDQGAKSGFQAVDNNKKEFYQNTYIHLTSETSFFGDPDDEPFFSEKTFRPIANLQPFIMIGDVYSLRFLKKIGFKTFHPVIDETYDLETDHNQRMRLIEKEIVKLNNMSQRELHDFYHSLLDILIYNRNHFITFKDSNPFQISYEYIEQSCTV